jgi:hypothetical protein
MTINFKKRAAEVSPTWARFLDFVERHPTYAQPTDMTTVSCDYPVQSWPTFISSELRADVAQATTSVFRLLRSIPSSIFGNDTNRIADYYRINPRGLAPTLCARPNGLDIAIGRADLIYSASGFKCIELNPFGSLGGLETEFMIDAYRHTSPFSHFVAESGIALRHERCMLTLFEYMATVVRQLGIADEEINIAIVADGERPAFGAYSELPNAIFRDALANIGDGVRGTLIRCQPRDIKERNGDLYCAKIRLHAVWEYAVLKHYPARSVLAFKRGRIAYFNSPISGYLGCKRSLALLSQALESDAYDDKDRSAIEHYVPWTRELIDQDVIFEGRRRGLLDLLRVNRAGFVLKKGQSYGGDEVHIGECTPDDQWERVVRTGMDEGTWLVQEYIEPRTFMYQSGGEGHAPCRAVWGGFCYGDRFGGAYLRIFPEFKSGPINSARGAMTGLVFET